MKIPIGLRPSTNQWLLFLTIVLFCSCTYKTDEVYLRQVNQNAQPPTIQVIQLDLQKDTIVLHKNVNVSFEFKSLGQPIYRTIVTIDGKEPIVINSDKGTFLLSFNALSDGLHDLQLDLYTQTLTGSIADKLNAEVFVTTKKWKILVYKDFKTDVTSDVVNGLLKIKLSPYKAPDFKEFIVLTDDYPEKSERRIASTEFIDSSYFGQDRRYTFKVLTNDGLMIPWGTILLTADFPKTSLKQTGKHQYSYCFEKAKYYSAVDSFIIIHYKGITSYDPIYQQEEISSVGKVVKRTVDYRDTIYNYTDSILCQNQSMILKIISKVNASGLQKRSVALTSRSEILTGSLFSFAGSYYIEPISNEEFIYFKFQYSGVICKYSIPQGKVIEENAFTTDNCYPRNTLNISVCPSGKYATYFEPCGGSVRFINTAKLQNVTSFNLDTYFGNQKTYPAVPISDIATGIINFNYGGFSLYDFANSKLIAKYREKIYGVTGLKISADGHYFWVKEAQALNLIQLKEEYFSNSIASLNFANVKYFDFDKSTPGQLFLYKENTFSIKKCSDFSDIVSYTLLDSLILSVDSPANEMLTFNSGYLFVRNITDGKILHRIPCGFVPYNRNIFCYLRNHTIIFSKGVIYSLN